METTEVQPTPKKYPPEWKHVTVHWNSETGELLFDGDKAAEEYLKSTDTGFANLFEANDALVARLEAVLAREKFKDERIEELEGILARRPDYIAPNAPIAPAEITVTHKLDKDTHNTLISAAMFAGPGRPPSKWYTAVKEYCFSDKKLK